MQQLIESWQDFAQREFKDVDFGDNVKMKLVCAAGQKGGSKRKRSRKHAGTAALTSVDAKGTDDEVRI